MFDAGFDKSIEVSFGVNPSIIKPADVDEFTQVVASFDLEPGINIDLDRGESHYLKTELREGNYFLIVNGEKKALNIVVVQEKTTEAQKITFDVQGQPAACSPSPWQSKARRKSSIVNKERGEEVMTFARLGPQRWPSAAVVSSLQDFRDLFSSEMLSLNETFSIENLGFLFTDLKGSTEMYERLGDAQAFALVKEHFYIMERLVREHNGAIVKTIGDAVMAVFTDPRDALRTAVDMIEAFDDMDTVQKLKNSIIVKVGIHHGPCIAVTLNERIDYFGTTVNIAARVQGLSDGRDVMAIGSDIQRRRCGGLPAPEGLAERAIHDESQGSEVQLRGAQAAVPTHRGVARGGQEAQPSQVAEYSVSSSGSAMRGALTTQRPCSPRSRAVSSKWHIGDAAVHALQVLEAA